jgi:hypothetical protein
MFVFSQGYMYITEIFQIIHSEKKETLLVYCIFPHFLQQHDVGMIDPCKLNS